MKKDKELTETNKDRFFELIKKAVSIQKSEIRDRMQKSKKCEKYTRSAEIKKGVIMNKQTEQKVIIGDSRHLTDIEDNSVDLVVTSPPYPMIAMWDDIFTAMNNNITQELIEKNPQDAFELMNKELDKVYDATIKKLKNGAIVCINIGDATRTCNGNFALYPNGARTVKYFLSKGFSQLPSIIWNKPTNSPNKFMGSGMLPVGAYNTLEFEHVLIFRKNKRSFTKSAEKENRQKSAFFWNERNEWCSNIWNFVGARQQNKNSARERNGAFPIELPYRLVSLLSVKGDVVLDMFAGTGTTLIATSALGRNGIAVEYHDEFKNEIIENISKWKDRMNKKNDDRIINYRSFLIERTIKGKSKPKYINEFHNIDVMTKQEVNIEIPKIKKIYKKNENSVIVEYE